MVVFGVVVGCRCDTELRAGIHLTAPNVAGWAGCLGVFEERRKVSADGLEMTFAVSHPYAATRSRMLCSEVGCLLLGSRQVNVAAPFLLTGLLLPLLKRRSGSRIVNVSSISQGSTVRWDDLQYEKPGSYSEHSAYSLSKLLMAMFSMELAKRVGSRNLPVVSCDPGTVNTKMLLAGSLLLLLVSCIAAAARLPRFLTPAACACWQAGATAASTCRRRTTSSSWPPTRPCRRRATASTTSRKGRRGPAEWPTRRTRGRGYGRFSRASRAPRTE